MAKTKQRAKKVLTLPPPPMNLPTEPDNVVKPVPQALADLGEIYQTRTTQYGANYKLHGYVMVGLFPDGVALKSIDDFNRYSCLKEMATRLGRYAHNFSKGGHPDSLNDIAVYSQMLQELDHERQK